METKDRDKDYTIGIYDYMESYMKWEFLIKKKQRKTKINNLLTILGDQKMIDITKIKQIIVSRVEYIIPLLSEYTHTIEDPNLLLKILKRNYNDIQKSPYYTDINIYGLNTLEVILDNGITHYLKFDESFFPLKKSIRSHRIKKIK